MNISCIVFCTDYLTHSLQKIEKEQ
jgi:hypothetical protein